MSAHPEIDLVARRVLDLFAKQRAYLEAKPTEFLQDLQHRADEERFSETFSTRTAAEINRAACVVVLEERDVVAGSGVPALPGRAGGAPREISPGLK